MRVEPQLSPLLPQHREMPPPTCPHTALSQQGTPLLHPLSQGWGASPALPLGTGPCTDHLSCLAVQGESGHPQGPPLLLEPNRVVRVPCTPAPLAMQEPLPWNLGGPVCPKPLAPLLGWQGSPPFTPQGSWQGPPGQASITDRFTTAPVSLSATSSATGRSRSNPSRSWGARGRGWRRSGCRGSR